MLDEKGEHTQKHVGKTVGKTPKESSIVVSNVQNKTSNVLAVKKSQEDKKIQEALNRTKRVNVHIQTIMNGITRGEEVNIYDKIKIRTINEKIINNKELLIEDYMFIYDKSKDDKSKGFILKILASSISVESNYIEELFEKISFTNLKGKENLKNIYKYLFVNEQWKKIIDLTYSKYGKLDFAYYLKIINGGKFKELEKLKLQSRKNELKEISNKSILFRKNILHLTDTLCSTEPIYSQISLFLPLIYIDNKLFKLIHKMVNIPNVTKSKDIAKKIKGVNAERILTNIENLTGKISLNCIYGDFFDLIPKIHSKAFEKIINSLSRKELLSSLNELKIFDESKDALEEADRIIKLINKKNI